MNQFVLYVAQFVEQGIEVRFSPSLEEEEEEEEAFLRAMDEFDQDEERVPPGGELASSIGSSIGHAGHSRQWPRGDESSNVAERAREAGASRDGAWAVR